MCMYSGKHIFPIYNAATRFFRAREECERVALAREQARAAEEAAKAAAAAGPTPHEEEMFQAKAILQAAVNEMEGR